MRRVLELIERRLGPAPRPWCRIAFGSEGRKEQTFKTDQDNAVIFADPATPEEERQAREWFAPFTAGALLSSVIFFDFRPLHGETRLAVQLRDHLVAEIGRFPAFLGFMANQLVQNRPPSGFSGMSSSKRTASTRTNST